MPPQPPLARSTSYPPAGAPPGSSSLHEMTGATFVGDGALGVGAANATATHTPIATATVAALVAIHRLLLVAIRMLVLLATPRASGSTAFAAALVVSGAGGGGGPPKRASPTYPDQTLV